MGSPMLVRQETSWFPPVARRIALRARPFAPLNDHSTEQVSCRSDRLTRRERQICEHIREGLANKQIATRLGISTHTVKCHVHSALVKLGLTSRVQVAVMTGRWADRATPSEAPMAW